MTGSMSVRKPTVVKKRTEWKTTVRRNRIIRCSDFVELRRTSLNCETLRTSMSLSTYCYAIITVELDQTKLIRSNLFLFRIRTKSEYSANLKWGEHCHYRCDTMRGIIKCLKRDIIHFWSFFKLKSFTNTRGTI